MDLIVWLIAVAVVAGFVLWRADTRHEALVPVPVREADLVETARDNE